MSDAVKIVIGLVIFLALASFPIWFTATSGEADYRPELVYPQGEPECVEAREFTYFNRHGQFIFAEPCGRFAGYGYRHFSIHRGDLHF